MAHCGFYTFRLIYRGVIIAKGYREDLRNDAERAGCPANCHYPVGKPTESSGDCKRGIFDKVDNPTD